MYGLLQASGLNIEANCKCCLTKWSYTGWAVLHMQAAANAGKLINLPVVELLMWSNAGKQWWPNTRGVKHFQFGLTSARGLNVHFKFCSVEVSPSLGWFPPVSEPWSQLICLPGLFWLEAGAAAAGAAAPWQRIPRDASPRQGQASLRLKNSQRPVGDGDLHHPFNPLVPLEASKTNWLRNVENCGCGE